jgi:hypothetical protein
LEGIFYHVDRHSKLLGRGLHWWVHKDYRLGMNP